MKPQFKHDASRIYTGIHAVNCVNLSIDISLNTEVQYLFRTSPEICDVLTSYMGGGSSLHIAPFTDGGHKTELCLKQRPLT